MDGFSIGILIIHELMNSTKIGISEAFLFETSSSAVNRWTYEIDPLQYLIFTHFFPEESTFLPRDPGPASVIWSLSNTLAIWMAECPCKDPTSTMKRGMPSIYKMSSVCLSNLDTTW